MRMGCSQHHLPFPGTLSLRPETLRMVVHDLLDSLTRHGFRRVVLQSSAGQSPLTGAQELIVRLVQGSVTCA
jgi:creatinine amidohydrolase